MKTWLARHAASWRRLPTMHFRVGNFFDEVVRFAAEHATETIILPPREGRSGTRLGALAAAVGQPVLRMRQRERFRTFVVAATLPDDGHPALEAAIAASSDTEDRFVVAHDMGSWPAAAALRGALTERALLQASLVEGYARRLEHSAPGWPEHLELLVAHGPDSVGVILERAAQAQALIVVGASSKNWLGKSAPCDLAAEVLSRATGSVLVAPV